MLLLLLACKPKLVEPSVEPVRREPTLAPVPPPPSGVVGNGEYVDTSWPVRLRVPEGWAVLLGVDGESRRVTLTDARTGAALELHVYADGVAGPHPRAGCDWTFEVSGHFAAVRVAEQVVAATCTAADPTAARVLGYYFLRDGVAYGLESVLPHDQLLEGKTRTEDAMGGLRFALPELGARP